MGKYTVKTQRVFWLLWKIKDQRQEEEENFGDFKMTTSNTAVLLKITRYRYMMSKFSFKGFHHSYICSLFKEIEVFISQEWYVIQFSTIYSLKPTSSHQPPRQTLLLQCRLCLKKEKRLPVWKIIVFSVSPDYITFWGNAYFHLHWRFGCAPNGKI